MNKSENSHPGQPVPPPPQQHWSEPKRFASSSGQILHHVWIMGTKVHDVTYDEALQAIRHFVLAGGPHQVITTNPEFVMEARNDLDFASTINDAALVIPDGIGLVWASRFLGFPIRQQVTGTDLVYKLMALAAAEGWRVFLLGAAEGVAHRAATMLEAMNPGLQIAGTYSGFPYPRHDEATISIINEAGHIDILLVAYGAPAQDKWIARNQSRLEIPVAIGVGGVFDFISGRVKRAPAWMRRFGLEWLFRLINQPWRWRRQLALPRFVVAVLALRLGRD
jgi:N-acetylglucosaminyldiphosphoundecaprenol N-acetyl-beta-D-mannosaminyltransferase